MINRFDKIFITFILIISSNSFFLSECVCTNKRNIIETYVIKQVNLNPKVNILEV